MFLENALFVVSIIGITYFYWLARCNRFWKQKGVAVFRPKFPFFGTSLDALFSLKSPHDINTEMYNQFPNERFVGTWTFMKPKLFLRDPELVNLLMTRDFALASNRGNSDNPKATRISMHLLNAKDDHWRSLRSKLAPTFTSGKLKGMMEQISICTDMMISRLEGSESDGCFEVRELTGCFTSDVIACCAFGLNINTLNDPNSMFRRLGRATFTFNTKRKLQTALRRWLGSKAIYLEWLVGGISPELVDSFVNAVRDTLAYRRENGIVRPDFLHLMNELCEKDQEMIRSGQLDRNDPQIFDETTLVSNAFVFFVAGFETTASAISFVMYELALHQDVQQKLFNEISGIREKYSNQWTEYFVNMKFLDQVVSETLRLHSPVPAIDRVVTQSYAIPGTDVVIPENSRITIPICALHHDPTYFPSPKTFSPERFSRETGQTIKKGTYLPFGNGPRICIGARFAKLVVKVAVAKMVLNYKFFPSEKTQVPLVYDKRSFMTVSEAGIWLRIERRAASKTCSWILILIILRQFWGERSTTHLVPVQVYLDVSLDLSRHHQHNTT